MVLVLAFFPMIHGPMRIALSPLVDRARTGEHMAIGPAGAECLNAPGGDESLLQFAFTRPDMDEIDGGDFGVRGQPVDAGAEANNTLGCRRSAAASRRVQWIRVNISELRSETSAGLVATSNPWSRKYCRARRR